MRSISINLVIVIVHMRLLELFSGTQSVGNVAREFGWEVVSLDLHDATINTDILDWEYAQLFEPGHFDVIWASPPCERFSALRRTWIGRHLRQFGDAPVTTELLDDDMIQNALPVLRRTEQIIDYFKRNVYFIENPRTGKMKDFSAPTAM